MKKEHLLLIGEYALKTAFVLAVIYFIYDFFYTFMPIALAILFAFVLQPVSAKLQTPISIAGKQLRLSENMAISLIMLVFSLILLAVLLHFILPFFTEVNRLMLALPRLAERFQSLSIVWNERLELLHLPSNVNSLLQQFLSMASGYSLELLRSLLQKFFSFASNTVGFVVMPILAFYFLKDGRSFSDSFVKMLPSLWRNKTAVILSESSFMVRAYIRGITIVAIISGLVVGTGTYMIGLEYPLVFGILAVVAEAIPIVGPIVSMMPALFFGYLRGPDTMIVVTVFYLIYYTFDAYIMSPRITGKYLKLHPVIIIVSILVGGNLAGIFGMVLAVPAVAVMRVFMRHLLPQESK